MILPVFAATSQSSLSPAKLYFQEGVTSFQDGNYSIAVEAFSKAIQVDTNYGAAYGNRCLSYIELHDYPSAIADCTAAITLTPSNAEAYLNRGLAHYRLGEYTMAITDFTQLLQITPHDHRAYYNRGLAYVGQSQYREALVDYGEALRQVSPLDTASITLIYNDQGVAHLMLGQDRAAIVALTQAIRYHASDARALFNRGYAYHRLGNETAALEDFSQVTVIDPSYAQAYLNRGLIQHQLGDQDKAIADLRQAAQQFLSQGNATAHRQTLDLLQKIQASPSTIG
ncbi:tetratricopeptide repeat protein [Alkalinema pantanalense]|uniref:tetratricopeptide repeat protein n=1 Tax=Alkalinema pantanalense TaxID=1620705 RepID=UPI003D6E00B4